MAGYKNNIYSPGQAKVLFDVWPEGVEWFVIGGPADANEAQTIHNQFPGIKCIGFEPHPILLQKQIELAFPGIVYPYALMSEDGSVDFKMLIGKDNSSSVCRDLGDNCNIIEVKTRSLDSLSEEFGPFTNIVLWIDIEHAELECLKGAKRLLESGQILMVNVEVFKEYMYQPIADYLAQYGLVEVKRWNEGVMPGMSDVIFKRESLI